MRLVGFDYKNISSECLTQQGLVKVNGHQDTAKFINQTQFKVQHTDINTHIPYSIISGPLRRKDTIPELSVCLQAGVKSVMMRSS